DVAVDSPVVDVHTRSVIDAANRLHLTKEPRCIALFAQHVSATHLERDLAALAQTVDHLERLSPKHPCRCSGSDAREQTVAMRDDPPHPLTLVAPVRHQPQPFMMSWVG